MSMDHLSTGQIKAARALLNWSQEDLALATGLSIATIRKLELGFVSPRASTMLGTKKALENAGIEFTDADGIKRKQDNIKIYEGSQGCAAFLCNLEVFAGNEGGDFCAVSPSTHKRGFEETSLFLKRIEEIVDRNRLMSAKILLTDCGDLPLSTLRLEYRSISTNYVDPMPFCVFGNRYAYTNLQEQKIIAFQSQSAAEASRKHFNSMWGKAFCMLSKLAPPRTLLEESCA